LQVKLLFFIETIISKCQSSPSRYKAIYFLVPCTMVSSNCWSAQRSWYF
jgi:hypothetical protein